MTNIDSNPGLQQHLSIVVLHCTKVERRPDIRGKLWQSSLPAKWFDWHVSYVNSSIKNIGPRRRKMWIPKREKIPPIYPDGSPRTEFMNAKWDFPRFECRKRFAYTICRIKRHGSVNVWRIKGETMRNYINAQRRKVKKKRGKKMKREFWCSRVATNWIFVRQNEDWPHLTSFGRIATSCTLVTSVSGPHLWRVRRGNCSDPRVTTLSPQMRQFNLAGRWPCPEFVEAQQTEGWVEIG